MPLPDHPFFDVATPTILGHRGAAGDAPENTLYGFERALAAGAHVLESDVHATRDGVAVLIHDPELARTTNGRGRVDAHSWDEVQRFDAAHHFRPGHADGQTSDDTAPPESQPAPLRGRGLRIPSLREAFEAFPDARFNLEIKHPDPAVAADVVALVRSLGREERTLLTAGDDAIMAGLRAAMREAGSRAAIGASLSDILAFVKTAAAGERPDTDSMALQVPASFAGQPLVRREFVEHAHRFGAAVHVWTIDEPAEMTRLLDEGVDGLVTDYPARMAGLLAQR